MGKAFLVISMTSHHIEEYRHPGYSTRRVQSYFLGSRKNRHAGKIRHIDFACHSEYSICRIMLPFNDVSYFTSCFWRKPYAKFNLNVFFFFVVCLSSHVYVLVRSSHRQAEFAVGFARSARVCSGRSPCFLFVSFGSRSMYVSWFVRGLAYEGAMQVIWHKVLQLCRVGLLFVFCIFCGRGTKVPVDPLALG